MKLENHLYDLEGNPITLPEHLKLKREAHYGEIGHAEVGNVRIYTAWHGMDRRLPDEKGEPLIFSTTIYVPNKPNLTEVVDYPDLATAQNGHAEAVALITEKNNTEGAKV